jgi:hypothetical protein
MLLAMISKVLVVMVKHVTTFFSLFGVTTEGGMLGAQGPCEVLAFYVPSVSSHSVTSPSISSPVCQMQHQHMYQILLPQSGQNFGSQSQPPTSTGAAAAV